MTVRELSDDQLAELKQRMADEEIYEVEGRNASYGELAAAESIPDEKVFEQYDGVDFSNDDFCTASQKDKTGYAACWCDDYDCDFGVYKVFHERGKCLDYLTDMVFERAKLLEVDVVDQSAKYITDKNGNIAFPKMTWAQVRDQLGSGMDFSLVLRTRFTLGILVVEEQVSVGIREVEIE